MWTPGERFVRKLCPQEGVRTMSTEDPDPNRLVLWFWTVSAQVHRSQIDDAFTVGPWAGYPLGRDLADEQTVTGTAHVLLPYRSVLYGSGFVADAALDHMLVSLSFHRDGALTDPAADPRTSSVWADTREGVGGRRFHHICQGGAGEGRLKVVGFGWATPSGAVRTVVLIGQQRRPLPVRHGSRHFRPGTARPRAPHSATACRESRRRGT